jgi:hypothetical protein
LSLSIALGTDRFPFACALSLPVKYEVNVRRLIAGSNPTSEQGSIWEHSNDTYTPPDAAPVSNPISKLYFVGRQEQICIRIRQSG